MIDTKHMDGMSTQTVYSPYLILTLTGLNIAGVHLYCSRARQLNEVSYISSTSLSVPSLWFLLRQLPELCLGSDKP
jgi:hypothetical protein